VSDFQRRLDMIGEMIAPKFASPVCMIFGDDDADAAVIRFREHRNWPDDGAHPVQVIRVKWVSSR
jgi:hypothetical protein